MDEEQIGIVLASRAIANHRLRLARERGVDLCDVDWCDVELCDVDWSDVD